MFTITGLAGGRVCILEVGRVFAPITREVHHEKRKVDVVCNAGRSGFDLFRSQEG